MSNDNQNNPNPPVNPPKTETTVLPPAVTYKGLEEKYQERAGEIYHAICNIGEFGSFGSDFMDGHPSLDLSGITDTDKRAQIAALLK